MRSPLTRLLTRVRHYLRTDAAGAPGAVPGPPAGLEARVRYYRERLGHTQKATGRALHLSEDQVRRVERKARAAGRPIRRGHSPK